MKRLAPILLALVACDAVPDIYFAAADGAPNDAGNESASPADGAIDGAIDGAVVVDGAAVCPTAPPAGSDSCCGDTPCKGACTPSSCAKCGTCLGTEVCCAKTVNAICKTPQTCN